MSGGDFCGCCGRQCNTGELWCRDCKAHVLDGGHLWERTYFARYERECPFMPPEGAPETAWDGRSNG